jgi:hypothetical protein
MEQKSPRETRLFSAAAAVSSASEVGCVRFEVRVSGVNRIEVVDSTGADCGTVRPVLAGTPTFDEPSRTVRLPIALENRGERKLKAPARLFGWDDDSLTVVSPKGLVKYSDKYLTFTVPDSVMTDPAAPRAGARVWRYDDLLAGAGESQVLAAGGRSRVRWVQLTVHPGVETFRLSFHAEAQRMSNPVPAIAPEEIPAWVYDEANVITDSPLMSGRFLRNIVVVLFKMGATQEERQTAIDLVEGEVVGGRRLFRNDGFYYVRIQDDGTAGPLFAAIKQLKALLQVEGAIAELVGMTGPAYLTANDGPGWNRRRWRLHPDSAQGQNWGLDAISAPHAWGCTTGRHDVAISIVDEGFHSEDDLRGNLHPESDVGLGSLDNYHGTAVASILAAEGNNAVDMAGIMWKAQLRLYDIGLVPSNPLAQLVGAGREAEVIAAAVLDGAKVVNLSRQLKWPYVPGTAADSNIVETFSGGLRLTIQRLELLGYRPLIVVSAGNYDMDAYWAGYPNLQRDFPDRVIVVGAPAKTALGNGDYGGSFARHVKTVNGRQFGSNWGSRVEVAAPGANVGGIGGAGTVVDTLSGTSFAAPYVSGLAGLLWSFDPRLSARDVKDLILDGAVMGGRSINNGPAMNMGPVPLINAYQSLRAAAERSGAPLCGNPVWQDNQGNVFAKRGARWQGTSEQIFTESGPELSPMHSRSMVRFASGTAYEWQNSSWNRTATSHPADNATNLSKLGKSHGDVIHEDTTATASKRNVSPTEEWFNIKLNGSLLVSIKGDPVNPKPAGRQCVRRTADWDCLSYVSTYYGRITSTFSIAYSPAGDQVALSVARDTSSYWVDTKWQYCGWDEYCANHGLSTGPVDSKITFINIPQAKPVRVWTVPASTVDGVGFSEGGTHLLMRRTVFIFNSTNTPWDSFSSRTRTCTTEYWKTEGDGQKLFHLPYLDVAPSTCYKETTFAP